jgi:hypothetical protein
VLWQGFRVQEEAIDSIEQLAEQNARKQQGAGNGITFTVVASSYFFKDYDKIFRCCSLLRPAPHIE